MSPDKITRAVDLLAEAAHQRGAAIARAEKAEAHALEVAASHALVCSRADAAERARDEMRKDRDRFAEIVRSAETTARHIIAVCNGNGGVDGLGNSDVEVAIRRLVLDHVEQTHRLVAARDEVGIQLVAAQAEIARLHKGLRDVERFMLAEWRPPAEAVLAMVRDVASGGPSVPGDALADDKVITERFPTSYGTPPSPAGASVQPSGGTPAASSAMSSGLEVEGNPSAPSGIHDTEDPTAGLLAASGISNVKEKA